MLRRCACGLNIILRLILSVLTYKVVKRFSLLVFGLLSRLGDNVFNNSRKQASRKEINVTSIVNLVNHEYTRDSPGPKC